MRVYRGRAGTVDADRAVTAQIVEGVACGEDLDAGVTTDGDSTDRDDSGRAVRERPGRHAAVRVWTPPRQVAFGRRDATVNGYDRAREAARERGFPPVEREVGGRPVAFTGTTVAFVRATPVSTPRSGLRDRYDATMTDLLSALDGLGVDASEGEPPGSFCPGSHSLQAPRPDDRQTGRDGPSTGSDGNGRKLAGLAQRVRTDVAIVAGVLVVRDHDAVADVLDPVYATLDVPFEPRSVGSVALAGGETDPGTVVGTVEDALVGDEPVRVETVAAGE